MPTLNILLGAFGAGVYSIVAVTHLDLWSRRRGRPGHLWLALASIGALVVDVTGILVAFVAAAWLPWLLAFNLLGVAGATASLLELAAAFSERPSPRWRRGLQFATLSLALMAPVFEPFEPAVLVCCAILLAASVREAMATARKAGESRTVARAYLILAACLLADLIKEIGHLAIPDNLPIAGFTVLFIAAARSLNRQFERDHDASRSDALTGLRNRRGLLEALDDVLHRARRSGSPVCIVLADLDHFKRVNDAGGHLRGDAILIAVAKALRDSLRAQDIVARWGGEEFMLVLPDTDLPGAAHVAEQARQRIASGRFEADGMTFELTLSLGVARHAPEGDTAETLREADRALYQAKAEGRNRTVFA